MEIYNVGKYENIAERMRRLAASPPHSTAVDRQPGQHLVRSKELTFGQKYQGLASCKIQGLKDSPTVLQKVIGFGCDRREVEQGLVAVSGYINQSKGDAVAFNSQVMPTRREVVHQFYLPVENKAVTKSGSGAIEKELQKVKSEGNMKIEQILQSYSKYKLNKQQFLDGMRAKNISGENEERIARQSNHEGDTTIAQNFETAVGRENIFQPIDRIWNETDAETENEPRFELSKGDNKKRTSDCTIEEDDTNSSWRDYRLQNLPKCRLICKNVPTDKQLRLEPTIKGINSPRGTRVPGKICKNSTFTATERFVS